jgi:2-haloacid dehalogenase
MCLQPRANLGPDLLWRRLVHHVPTWVSTWPFIETLPIRLRRSRPWRLRTAAARWQALAVVNEPPKALLFDVFGTVVDWRSGGVIRAGQAVVGRGSEAIDWGTFADDWRKEVYLGPISEVAAGTRPFTPFETLLEASLANLVARHRLDLGSEGCQALLGSWRRLDPWPDAVCGLERLRPHFLLAPLSNGSFAQLTEMAKRARLPWDCIISTELFGVYKPDPAAYRGALDLLGLRADDAMLVAAHSADLRAAAGGGMHTAYVPRPQEWGPAAFAQDPDPEADLVVADLEELADRLVGPA